MILEIGNGTQVHVSVWALLFVALFMGVCLYVLYRLVVRREEKKRDALVAHLERERQKERDEVKRQTLAGVSQTLLSPVTLIISPLQQLLGESAAEGVRGQVQLVLRNAQMLLHQVNMLPLQAPAPNYQTLTPELSPRVPSGDAKTSASQGGATSMSVDDHNAAEVASKQGEHTEEGESAENHRFTMLMVDDSSDMCRFVRDYFRGDYKVLTAGNGEQALQCLQENDGVDLVVSDVSMPKMDGLELCKRIKTDLRWSHIPVILLTGRTGHELEVEGLKLGADDYITKPFNVEMLRLRVKKFIENRENRQRQFREKMDVAPSEITITSVDEQFIQQAIKICEDHISDTEFSVEVLGHELSLSRTYLYKKLINITGKGPAEFIRTIRMKRGKQYLEKTSMQITEIAAALGYNNPKRFTENFKIEYGMSPSEYTRKYRAERTAKTVM